MNIDLRIFTYCIRVKEICCGKADTYRVRWIGRQVTIREGMITGRNQVDPFRRRNGISPEGRVRGSFL
jgi:hypothetical protein